ncbi:MAG: hypothetical protein ACPHEP_09195, partial [Acidimicrobiales bacterium]
MIAVETKLGIGASNAASAQAATPLVHTGSGTSQWQAMSATTGQDVILYSETTGDNLTWDASAASLTITGGDGALAFDVPDGFARFDEAIQANGGVTGNLTGTVLTASQTNITSLGTLTGLSVSGNITVTGNVDGRDVSADGTKLDGIESGATADQTASEILTAIKTVDGSGSGLDADLLDGLNSASFLRSDASDSTSGTLTISNSTKALDLTGTDPKIYWDSTAYMGYVDSTSRFEVRVPDNYLTWSMEGNGNYSYTALYPSPTATQILGGTSNRWLTIYSVNSLDVSSDATMKNVSNTEAPGMEFIRLLRSTEWEWADKSWGEGTQWGPTAQNIRDALAQIGRKSSMVSGEEGNLSVRSNDLLGSFINALK